MKKLISILFLFLIAGIIPVFAQTENNLENENPDAEIIFHDTEKSVKKNYGMNMGLGITFGFIPFNIKENGFYKSEVLNIPFYLDPYYHVDWSFKLGKYFSIDPFVDLNFVSAYKGVDWFFDMSSKWTDFMNLDDYYLFKYTLYGLGEGGLFLCATIYSVMGVDAGVKLNVHPYTNDFYDLKIGVGLQNNPSIFFDNYGYSIWFYPTADLRIESIFYNSWGLINLYTGYTQDIISLTGTTSDKLTDLSMLYGGVCFSLKLKK